MLGDIYFSIVSITADRNRQLSGIKERYVVGRFQTISAISSQNCRCFKVRLNHVILVDFLSSGRTFRCADNYSHLPAGSLKIVLSGVGLQVDTDSQKKTVADSAPVCKIINYAIPEF